MKKKPEIDEVDEVLPEYDFSKGVRGKYAERCSKGAKVIVTSHSRGHKRSSHSRDSNFRAQSVTATRGASKRSAAVNTSGSKISSKVSSIREGAKKMAGKEKVTKIIDGDTFETSRRKKPVRLANVDAPEKGQPGYAAAKKALGDLLKDQEVRIDTVARDKYGRAVAKVYIGRESVNKVMKEKIK